MLNNPQILSNEFIVAQDNFDRYMAQSKSLLVALSAEDQFKAMSDEHIAGSLWLLFDRLNDLQTAHEHFVALVEGG